MEQAENDELHRKALIKSERRINYWGFANPKTLTSPERQETTKNRIAERTTAMEAKLAIAIENMEKKKAADLKRLADRTGKPQATGTNKPKQTSDVISGIAYRINNPMVLLGNQIYGEGETADGVTIVKSPLGKVEFKKIASVGVRVSRNRPIRTGSLAGSWAGVAFLLY